MQLKEITKTYGSNNVLDHIDFDFAKCYTNHMKEKGIFSLWDIL